MYDESAVESTIRRLSDQLASLGIVVKPSLTAADFLDHLLTALHTAEATTRIENRAATRATTSKGSTAEDDRENATQEPQTVTTMSMSTPDRIDLCSWTPKARHALVKAYERAGLDGDEALRMLARTGRNAQQREVVTMSTEPTEYDLVSLGIVERIKQRERAADDDDATPTKTTPRKFSEDVIDLSPDQLDHIRRTLAARDANTLRRHREESKPKKPTPSTKAPAMPSDRELADILFA